jgi:hypothetical protein
MSKTQAIFDNHKNNTFTGDDTLAIRVAKLNEQTGITFYLAQDTQRLHHLDLFDTAKGEFRSFTGSMTEKALLHWTATFALGFRVAHPAFVGQWR